MRSAVGQAQNAITTANNTAASEGANASSISSVLQPFLTQQLLHPQGYSQQDTAAQLSSAEAGAGGASSAITGDAALQAARTRNPAAFTGALDEAARDRMKAAAGASEGIAAKNADVKLDQQSSAEKGLSGMYGQDTDAMLKSMGLVPEDINAESNADKTGWFQNMTQLLASLNGAGAKTSGGGGFTV